MPLPAHPLTVHGGCNCRAIRYRIDIPAVSERPANCYFSEAARKSNDQRGLTFPMVAIDHCNDCRRATGSILPFWICTPIEFVTTSCLLRSASSPSTGNVSTRPEAGDENARTPWLPAEKVFAPNATSRSTFLSFYQSSEGCRRSFCGKCGTNLSYAAFPGIDGWPETLDIVLGTVDREVLDEDWLTPERHLWWECGIEWVRKFASKGAGDLPKHPTYKIDEAVD